MQLTRRVKLMLLLLAGVFYSVLLILVTRGGAWPLRSSPSLGFAGIAATLSGLLGYAGYQVLWPWTARLRSALKWILRLFFVVIALVMFTGFIRLIAMVLS